MTPAEVKALAKRVRRRLRDPDVAAWPEPTDEQIRKIAALLPPAPPGGDHDAA